MQQNRVTVYDIARELSISPATVSRVLNNSVLVGPELRDRILEAADVMGYRKRRIRRPGSRSILNIALVLPHLADASLHLFYDAAELIAGIEAGFAEVRVNIITVLSERAAALYEHKKLGGIDGCIFAFTAPEGEVRLRLESAGTPWIVLNRIEPNGSYVAVDNEGGVALLVGRMRAAAPRAALCYLGLSAVPSVNEQRERGFRRAAEENGLDHARVMTIDGIRNVDAELVGRIRRFAVRGVVCFNDVVAVAFCQAALEAGVSIPRDLMVSGFDDSPVRRLASREIESVSLSTRELGRRAGAWLRSVIVDRIDTPLRELVEGRLVAGDTIVQRS